MLGVTLLVGSFSGWMQLSALSEETEEMQICKGSGSVVWLMLFSWLCRTAGSSCSEKEAEGRCEQIQMLQLPCSLSLGSLLTCYIRLLSAP